MRSPSYLLRSRHGVFYFRVSIPKALRLLFPQLGWELRRSLQTQSLKQAKQRARYLKVQTELAFEVMKTKRRVKSQEASPEVEEIISTVQHYCSKAADYFKLDLEHRDDSQNLSQEDFDNLLSRSEAFCDVIDDIEKEKKKRRYEQHYGAIRSDLDPDYQPSDASNLIPSDQPSSKRAASLVSEVVKKFVFEKMATKKWREKTKQEYEASYSLFIRIVGDLPISQVKHDQVNDYKDVLLQLPANLNKTPEYRDKAIAEVLSSNPEPMDVTTAGKHITRLSTLLGWAERHGYVSTNCAAGMTISKNKDDDGRVHFKKADLEKLFHSEDYLRCKHRNSYGFWLPLLGMFTGARLNELCQLHLADFKQQDGIWTIHIIDDTPDKTVKNRSSRRYIPIHQTLMKLGLLQFVEQLKSENRQRLFYELNRSRDGYTAQPSKWFGRFKIRCGLIIRENEKKDFHSFRHTVADYMKQHSVPIGKASAILGHEQDEGISYDVYGGRYSIASLKEVVDQIDFGISLEHLTDPKINPYLT